MLQMAKTLEPIMTSEPAIMQYLLRNRRRRLEIFRELEPSQQGPILIGLDRRLQIDIMQRLHNHELVIILNHLDPDRATDLLRQLPPGRSRRIADQLSSQVREKVEFLLKFHPKTAAGMMDIDYVLAKPRTTFGEVARLIQEHDQQTGRPPIVLVMEKGKLYGELPAYVLALHPPSAKVGQFVRRLPTLIYNADERTVVDTFVKHPHRKIVVFDDDGAILGIVHSDDVLALLDKHALRDLYNFAGVSNEEDALDSPTQKFRHRWLWLMINLGTAFLAAATVGLFENTIAAFTLLAVYMPIVAGMGGNAGTQTMAVAVRGIVLKEVDLATGWKFIRNEVLAGFYNGVVNGVVVATVAIIFNKSPMLGLVLALAMVANLIIAGFFGAIIPLIMKAFGKDPATSATIFITTCTDVGGFFVFLSLAKLLLKAG